eukprot:g5798.t1
MFISDTAVSVDKTGNDEKRTTETRARWARLLARTKEFGKAHFAQSGDVREDETTSAEEVKEYRDRNVGIEQSEGNGEEGKASPEVKEDGRVGSEQSGDGLEKEIPSPDTEEDSSSTDLMQSEDHSGEVEPSPETEEDFKIDSEQSEDNGEKENSPKQEQLDGLVHRPLAFIADKPRLLPGEIAVFVKTYASEWVVITIRPTGSVVDLKRAIKDAKDKSYRSKFGESVGCYRHFSSGNLKLNDETLNNTYVLKQGHILVEEKTRNRCIVGGKRRPLEICGGGGGGD